MAIAAAAQWECWSTATAGNVNGGFFVTGASGVDYSQQAAAQYNLTGATSAGAGAVILHASAAADMVGNGAHVISGTNWTAGWYEILSVSVGVSITVDRNCTSGVGAVGVVNIGGAISLGAAGDNTFFQTGSAGNTIWIKNTGTYTLGASVSRTVAGSLAAPFTIRGYNTVRGDNPTTKTTQPKLVGPFYTDVANQIWRNLYLSCIGAGNNGIDSGGIMLNCTVINSDPTANNSAIFCANGAAIIGCEIVCYRGKGIVPNTSGCLIAYNYIHDCDIGASINTTSSVNTIIGNIFAGCVTASIRFLAAQAVPHVIASNTFYGAPSKLGTAVLYDSTTAKMQTMFNNVFYGFATGVSAATSTKYMLLESNTFFNNTADVTNVTKGAFDIALDPGFTGVGEYTGTTATTAAGVLTDSGANFANVVTGRDYLYLVSGTGITAGKYGISAKTATSITPDIAPGNDATADKVYKIMYGQDFTVGTNMKAAGSPGVFPAALSTSYLDIGAVQRQEAQAATTDVRLNTVYNGGTGSLAVPAASNVLNGVAVDAGTGTYVPPATVSARLVLNKSALSFS